MSRPGFFNKIVINNIKPDGMASYTSEFKLSRPHALEGETEVEQIKNALASMIKLIPTFALVTVYCFDTSEEFEEYENSLTEYWSADIEDRDHVFISEPETISCLIRDGKFPEVSK